MDPIDLKRAEDQLALDLLKDMVELPSRKGRRDALAKLIASKKGTVPIAVIVIRDALRKSGTLDTNVLERRRVVQETVRDYGFQKFVPLWF